MTPAARLSAAIEVLADIETRRRPAPDALKDWGLAHRFAGSKDRRAIGDLVFDALRVRSSSAYLLGEQTPRALVLGMLAQVRGQSVDAIAALCDGSRFAPEPLSPAEREHLAARDLSQAPSHIQADVPEWLWPMIEGSFGADAVAEARAMAARAPVDLRVNTLKAQPEKVQAELAHALPGYAVEAPDLSPTALRIVVEPGAPEPHLTSLPAYVKGHVEIQDLGSQVATLLSGAEPGRQVVDLCAGGGGKALALAALMDNRGQIFAYDSDRRRLAPIHERLERAGARNIQVRTPHPHDDVIADLENHMDLVLVDAPCSGSGTWRRNPDAKWRIRPGSIEIRVKEQEEVLERARSLVKPGSRLAYITCSILPQENDEQVAAFLARHADWHSVAPAELLAQAPAALAGRSDLISSAGLGLQMTPRRTGTDGFYVAMLRRES